MDKFSPTAIQISAKEKAVARAQAAFAAAERGPTAAELDAVSRLTLWQAILVHPSNLCLGCRVTAHPTLGASDITTSPLIWVAPDLSWALN